MISYLLFTASWSKPSQEVRDTLEKFFPELNVLICDANVTQKEHARYAVRKLPTLVKLKDGNEIGRSTAIDITELFQFTKEE